MARLLPTINVAEIENPGERKLAEALRCQLPERISVIHSFNWVRKERSGILSEGECDFILLDPARGLLFFEVKGGIITFDSRSDTWTRNHEGGTQVEINRDPIEQVRSSMYTIVDCLKAKLGQTSLPFCYGYAVAFPDGRFTGQLPASVTRELVVDAVALKDMEKALSRAFSCWHRKTSQPMSKEQLNFIEHALLPRYQVLPLLSDTVQMQEKILHRMTEEQKGLLDFLVNHNQALIEGAAGTGKTLLALAKAQELAGKGLRTLLLCYNRPLKEFLIKVSSRDFDDTLTVQNYHGLVYQLCEAAGLTFLKQDQTPETNFFTNETPELLSSACNLLPDSEKFDAVIVDEGQDFRELWWVSLDEVFRAPAGERHFYVFHDPRQNLYTDGCASLPGDFGKPFVLSKNCRNTLNIARHCANLIGERSSSREHLPEGHVPEIFRTQTIQQGFKYAEKIVRSLTCSSTGDLKPSQIALLAPRRSIPGWPEKLNNVAITRDIDQWQANAGILVHKLRMFKGLEADAVIVVNAPLDPDNSLSKSENYVARSRARHILYVIEVDDLQSSSTAEN